MLVYQDLPFSLQPRVLALSPRWLVPKLLLAPVTSSPTGPSPTPYLVIGAIFLLAFAALEEVGGGAACLGHLVLTDGLLGHGVPQLPQLITGHFLERNESALQGQGAPGALALSQLGKAFIRRVPILPLGGRSNSGAPTGPSTVGHI